MGFDDETHGLRDEGGMNPILRGFNSSNFETPILRFFKISIPQFFVFSIFRKLKYSLPAGKLAIRL